MKSKRTRFPVLLVVLVAAVAVRADRVDDYVKAALLKHPAISDRHGLPGAGPLSERTNPDLLT